MNPSPFEPRLGDTVKALPDGAIEGKLLPFGDASTPDRSRMRDWFDAKSDFGFSPGETISCPLFFHHGLDPARGTKRYDRGTIEYRDDGIYFKGKLDLKDADARDLYDKVRAGEMKMSSGVPAHLVQREKVGDTHYVKTWILGSDASITESPADVRTWVTAIKALADEAATKAVMEESGAGYAPANPRGTCPKCKGGLVCPACGPDDDEADEPGTGKKSEDVAASHSTSTTDGAVAAPRSLFDRLDASVADAEEVKGLIEKAVGSRGERGLSAAKRTAVAELAASLKSLSDALASLATPPAPVPAQGDAATAGTTDEDAAVPSVADDMDDLAMECELTLARLRLRD